MAPACCWPWVRPTARGAPHRPTQVDRETPGRMHWKHPGGDTEAATPGAPKAATAGWLRKWEHGVLRINGIGNTLSPPERAAGRQMPAPADVPARVHGGLDTRCGSLSRTAGTRRRARAERPVRRRSASPPQPGGRRRHPDVSAAVEGRLDRGGGHARFPDICHRRQREAAISTARLSRPLPARALAMASAVRPLPASTTTGRPLRRLAATSV